MPTFAFIFGPDFIVNSSKHTKLDYLHFYVCTSNRLFVQKIIVMKLQMWKKLLICSMAYGRIVLCVEDVWRDKLIDK